MGTQTKTMLCLGTSIWTDYLARSMKMRKRSKEKNMVMRNMAMRNMAKKNMAKKEAQRRLKPKFAKHHKCHRVMKAAITTTGGSKGDLVTLQPFINIESGSCHTSIGSLL